MAFELSTFPPLLKRLCLMVLITLTLGMAVGLYYITLNTGTSPQTIVKHYNGNETELADEFEISYAKNVKELTLTVHNHVISFTFIFGFISIMFYGVHSLSFRFKRFLLTEPFVSILLTFGSMYLIRFVHPNFVFLMILSSTIMYVSYALMVFFVLRELFFLKK